MPKRITLRGVIFDVDGTLGDTHAVLFPAFRAGLAVAGIRMTDDQIRARFGPTEGGIIRQLVPPDLGNQAVAAFHAAYADLHREHPDPFAGIPEALHALRQRGVRLAVATGKGARTAEITLATYGIAELFDIVVSGSEREFVKPDLLRRVIEHWGFPPGTVAYLGDVPWDVDAAQEVGAQALSAAWDPSADVEELRAKGPLALFHSTQDFLKWIGESVATVAG